MRSIEYPSIAVAKKQNKKQTIYRKFCSHIASVFQQIKEMLDFHMSAIRIVLEQHEKEKNFYKYI